MEVIGSSTGSSGTSPIASGPLPDTAGADLAGTHNDADTLAATVSGGKVLVTETSAASVLTQATKLASTVATSGGSAPATGELVMGQTPGSTALPIQTDSSGRTLAVGAGTAGSPAGGVLSVQGVSGGRAVPTSDATLDATVSGGAVVTKQQAGSLFTATSLTAAGAQVAAGAHVLFFIIFINYAGATVGVCYFNATAPQSVGAIPILVAGPQPNNNVLQLSFGTIGLYFSVGLWVHGTTGVAFSPSSVSNASISASYA